MSHLAEWFASSLLRNSLSLIVATLLVATCVKWMRLRSPAGEQWAWLLVLAQGVMFVWLTVPVPRDWLPQPPIEQTAPVEIDTPPVRSAPKGMPLRLEVPERKPLDRSTRPMEVIMEPEADTNTAGVPVPSLVPQRTFRERLPSWRVLLCAAWLAGVVAVIGIGIARYVAFARRLRQARPAPSDWSDEWKHWRAASGVRAPIPLVVTNDIGPALCRLPSGYQLVVPEAAWRELSATERSAVFRHELAHYRRGDLWWTLLTRLLASVHWFNPCAWWAARKYEAQSEFACDAAAAGDDPAAFSELLVQLASERSRRIAGVQSVAAGSVYERVQRLVNGENDRAGWRAAAPVVVAVLTIVVLSVRVEAVSDGAATAAAAQVENKTDVVGESTSPRLKDEGAKPNRKSTVNTGDVAEAGTPQPAKKAGGPVIKQGTQQTVDLLPARQNLGTVSQGATVEASVGAIVPAADVKGNSLTVEPPQFVTVTKTESQPASGPPSLGRSRVLVYFNVETNTVGDFRGDINVAYGTVEFAIPVEFTVIEKRDDIPRVLFVSSPFEWSAGESATLRQLTSSGRAAFDFRESLFDGGYPSPEFLSGYDVIVLQKTQLIHAGTHESLVKLLQDYVHNGGRLVVLANSFMAGTVHAANEIARPFGLTIDSPEIDDPNARDRRRLACRDAQIEPDVLTTGVDELTFFRASPIVVTDPALATHLVRSPVRSRDGVVSLARSGRGELVLLTQTVLATFFGDGESASNTVGDVGDNRQLFENLLFAPKPEAKAK